MDLPELLLFEGAWEEYLEQLYAIYQAEIVHGGLAFEGLPIRCRFMPPSNGKGYGFWHLISEGETEEERTPDFRRCERIRWIAWMIQAAGGDERVTWWKNTRGSSTHIVLWLEEDGFAVILAERDGYYLLKSAYCVKPHRAETFRKERDAYWKSQNG